MNFKIVCSIISSTLLQINGTPTERKKRDLSRKLKLQFSDRTARQTVIYANIAGETDHENHLLGEVCLLNVCNTILNNKHNRVCLLRPCDCTSLQDAAIIGYNLRNNYNKLRNKRPYISRIISLMNGNY